MLQSSPHDQVSNSGPSSPALNDRLYARPPGALDRPTVPGGRVCGGETPPRRVLSYSSTQPQPVHLLIVAILQRALDDLHLGGRFRVQALRWLNEHQVESQPGSFEWCCAALDLDADVVRRKYSTLAFKPRASASDGATISATP